MNKKYEKCVECGDSARLFGCTSCSDKTDLCWTCLDRHKERFHGMNQEVE